MVAATTGDVQALMDVLAPDVVLVADGGGVKKAAVRPILGSDKVARFLVGGASGLPVEAEVLLVNGAPGLQILLDGELDTIVSVVVEDGLITGLYAVRNPEKLAGVGSVVSLTR